MLLRGFAPLESTKPASGEVMIDASDYETNRVLFFDRFSVYHGDRFVEMHFGFYGRARESQKGLIVVLSLQALEEQKATFMDYLKKLGMPETRELPTCDLRGETEVVAADLMGMARHGEAVAETSFHIFSWKVAVEKARTSDGHNTLKASCVALLRCDVELQKRLVLSLYEGLPVESKTA
jgi:hypothetical protein